MENIKNLLEFEESGNKNKRYLTFWANGQLYGITTEDVVQIVGMQKITAVLKYPEYVKGIINLREEIYPVVDVRLRMGLPQVPYHDRTCIIIIKVRGKGFGLIVDGVEEVVDIEKGQILAPPQLTDSDIDDCITGIARMDSAQSERKNMILIMNAFKLVGDNLVYIAGTE